MQHSEIIARILADIAFCLASPEEFMVQGTRVSTTSIMRTVAALNPEATRAQFIEACAEHGWTSAATATKQFTLSRKLTVSDGGCVQCADGSLIETV